MDGRVGWGGVRWGGEVREGEGRGGVEDGKKPRLEQPWSSHDSHTMICAALVGHRGSESNLIGPHQPIDIPHWCHCSSCEFESLPKCPPGKHLTFDTLGMDSY